MRFCLGISLLLFNPRASVVGPGITPYNAKQASLCLLQDQKPLTQPPCCEHTRPTRVARGRSPHTHLWRCGTVALVCTHGCLTKAHTHWTEKVWHECALVAWGVHFCAHLAVLHKTQDPPHSQGWEAGSKVTPHARFKWKGYRWCVLISFKLKGKFYSLSLPTQQAIPHNFSSGSASLNWKYSKTKQVINNKGQTSTEATDTSEHILTFGNYVSKAFLCAGMRSS